MDRKTVGIMAGCLSVGLVIGVAIGCLVSFAITRMIPGDTAEVSNLPSKGMQLADFELNDLDGNSVQLSQFKGKPVVVNFWASWCGPCKEEMPLLQTLHEEHGDDLVLLGVNEQEPVGVVKSFAADNHLTFLFLADEDGAVGRQYRVRAYPTTFFIDADGVLQAQQIGSLNEQQLEGYLEKIGVNP